MNIKGYKYRFYPNEEQKTNFLRTFGTARHVWNWALDIRTKSYALEKKSVSYNQTSKLLTEHKKEDGFEWINDVSSVPLQQELRRLEKAFSNFFAKRAKYPKFKSKKNEQSIEYTTRGFRFKDGQVTSLNKMSL
jgi:putative transposase